MVSTPAYPRELEALLTSLPALTGVEKALIERAYHKAEQAHSGQTRQSGEPYFTHCVAVASILAEMKMDSETIAAALMHDIIEDTPVTFEEVKAEFGKAIAVLVDGVTKLKKLPTKPADPESNSSKRTSTVNKEMEYMRKVLLTMGDDIRIVLIKLADRLHNLRTLGYMPPHKQRRIARESMDYFAPLANRLGIWQMKWELEDLSFRYLEPESYRAIAKSLEERRASREEYVTRVAAVLRAKLDEHGIQATISARPKHIYSIYRKMKRKGVGLEQVYDVRALRVIVEDVPKCYLVLGLVHNLWRPIPSEFDDYIAGPKDNFYRSLHTAVYDAEGKTLEVQIRTADMHESAEYGIAAHWRYKEGSKLHDEKFDEQIRYLRRLMESPREVRDDTEAFLDRVKSEVFQDRVYAFTPKGDIIDLPMESTPIDFAYHVHTEIGHRCRGAKVNGKLVSLNYKLTTGDQVEIITAKRGGPSMDWLNPDLGYAKTERARSKIRYWFRKLNRDKHISLGREALERELKRMGVHPHQSFEAVMRLFEYDKLEDFLAAIGSGTIHGASIANRIMEEERRKEREAADELELLKPRETHSSLMVDTSHGINIMGTGGMLVKMATCCNPMPGDLIIGYVTRGRGVTVHRSDCKNMLSSSEPERLIEVSWGSASQEQRYRVPVEIVATDRGGLLSEISTIIANENVNIASVEVSTRQQVATLHLILEITSTQQLLRILSKIECIQSVVQARRRNMS